MLNERGLNEAWILEPDTAHPPGQHDESSQDRGRDSDAQLLKPRGEAYLGGTEVITTFREVSTNGTHVVDSSVSRGYEEHGTGFQ